MIDLSTFNENQRLAVMHEKGNMLVSASAGSGKTQVIITRIIRLITEEKISVNQILAVTFTTLAASEMKDKLNKALMKQYALVEDKSFISKQLELLPLSNISTIHSFCRNLLKEYFYEAGVDGSFTVADEVLAVQLKKKAIDLLFEKKYEEKNEKFLSLLYTYSKRRSDDNLKELVYNLYDYLSKETDWEKIINVSVENLEKSNNFINSFCKEKYLKTLCYIKEKFIDIYSLIKNSDKNVRLKQIICASIEKITNFEKAQTFFGFNFNFDVNLKGIRKNDENEICLDEIKYLFTSLRNIFIEISDIFALNEKEDEQNSLLCKDNLLILFDLVKDFDEKFTEVKIEENVLTFSDLEKYTYKLLLNTNVAEAVKQKFSYIFVDEYQDVNGIQDAIISAVSDNNLFMVGDYKQSIYSFRGCNPQYFIEKFNNYCLGNGGQVLQLDYNYRCSENIVNMVNNVFSRIMRKEETGIDYKNQLMKYGNLYGDYKGVAQFHILPEKIKEENEEEKREVYSVINALKKEKKQKINREGIYISNLILSSVGQKEIYDLKQKKYRKLCFGDIVILMRNLKGENQKLLGELIKNGIPVSCENEEGLGEYPEIKRLIEILKLIDCFYQDVPLATSLLAIGNINETELAEIRSYSVKGNFYECYDKYLKEKHNDISEKLKNFDNYFKKIRLYAEFENVGSVLTKIISERGYDLYYACENLGAEKVKRIERFVAAANQSGLKVHEFLLTINEFVKKIKVGEAGGTNSVRIMTDHGSKGLEFPFVILASNDKCFNNYDLKQELVKSSSLGIVSKSYDREKMTVAECGYRTLTKINYKEDSVKEEMRIMYVAMTRAMCELHIILDKEPANGDNLFLKINKPSDFFAQYDADIKSINCSFVEEKKEQYTQVAGKEVNKNLTDLIYKNLSFHYPFEIDTTLPLKRTVTDLNEHFDDDIERIKSDIYGSESGTAYHKFLEYCDFYDKNIEKQLKYFTSSGLISLEEAKLLNIDKLNSILSLDIFDKIKGSELYKEQKFCCEISANDILNTESEENVLVQGIIDLLAVNGKKAVLIDYKLSTIAKDNDLIKTYYKQLKLYKYAIEKCLKLEVKESYLVNILQEKIIKVDL